jgi:hypothetical protein
LELNIVSENDSKLVLWLNLINPTNQKISSVQSWLTFDEKFLKWIDIDTWKSPFNFWLPWETNFDWNLVKIWRASLTPETTTKNKIFIANITFEKKIQERTEINFYNYQIWEKWNVLIQVLDNWVPVNTISKKPFWVVIWEKKFLQKINDNSNYYAWKEPWRPKNVRIFTKENFVKLNWDLDVNVNFYHIYYWKISWKYINRKKIWKFNSYKIRDLLKWERYYFALKAILNSWKETNYSNEVSVIVWKNNIKKQWFLKANLLKKEKTYWNYSKKYVKIRQNVKTWWATLFLSIILSITLWLIFFYRKKILKIIKK